MCTSEERHVLVDSCRCLSPDLRCLNRNDRCLNSFRSFKMSFKAQYFEHCKKALNWVLRMFFFCYRIRRQNLTPATIHTYMQSYRRLAATSIRRKPLMAHKTPQTCAKTNKLAFGRPHFIPFFCSTLHHPLFVQN